METYPDLKPVGIGKDSVAIVVHPSNGVSELTMAQASKIFSGEIKNWKEVGGADEAIRVITREEGSGTREVFEKFVMKPSEKEIAGAASVKPSNGEVRATVSGDEKSIGYLSLGYVDPSVKALKIDGVEATVENVLSDKYPIVRTLYLITKGEPSELEKAFIDFALSDEGQNVVEDMGYIKVAAAPTPAELSGELTIAGSTTVLPINQECARLLMENNPALRISISGGGSGHGVKSVGAGEIDIGAASRDVKSEEMETYPDLKPVGIGKDSVAIVVHPSNGVSELTMEQASKIFSGEITNWKEVGGADEAIRVITREEGSGTREVFEKFVMKPSEKEIAGKASVKPSNGEVRATVSGDKKSIGYVSLGYVDPSVKALKIDGVEATVENVLADKYPIVRTLYLITKGEPDELEKAFIDFVLSEEGQNVVEDMGYIKLTGEVTPAPTPKVTPKPKVTPTQAPMPTATPTQTPGFEAVFAIAVLLAIAYAALRRRK
ncbi:MAG TPA: hypothetical protein C5S37_12495 [Methanophagales archaeon]|nr:hypothetical protein [Methanophagales archaeon]